MANLLLSTLLTLKDNSDSESMRKTEFKEKIRFQIGLMKIILWRDEKTRYF